MSDEKPPFHRTYRKLTEKAISAEDALPTKSIVESSQMWPKSLFGRSLEWKCNEGAPDYIWVIRDDDPRGYRFRVAGGRPWAAIGLTPDQLTIDQLRLVFASGITREFISVDPPRPGEERWVTLQDRDFEDVLKSRGGPSKSSRRN